MKIDREWLTERGACPEGKKWFISQGITEPIAGIKNLIAHDKLDWANWLIVRVMERKQYLAYAVFAAEQVIDIFEKEYPDDARPRKAIEAAKAVIANDTEENRTVAWEAYAAAGEAAGDAVWAAGARAADAAWVAAEAARAAWVGARAAAEAGARAAWVADAAAGAARAAWAADAAARAAGEKMEKKILEYGLSLLETGKYAEGEK